MDTLWLFIDFITIAAVIAGWQFRQECRMYFIDDRSDEEILELKHAMFMKAIRTILTGVVLAVLIALLTMVFGGNETIKTTFDAKPKNFQVLVNFSAYNSNTFYVDDGENMTFITGGTRPGPLMMATVTANKNNCQIFDDCPKDVESYVVTRTVKTEYRQRWLIFYRELPNEISYLYELHLHPNEITGL